MCAFEKCLQGIHQAVQCPPYICNYFSLFLHWIHKAYFNEDMQESHPFRSGRILHLFLHLVAVALYFAINSGDAEVIKHLKNMFSFSYYYSNESISLDSDLTVGTTSGWRNLVCNDACLWLNYSEQRSADWS